MAEVSIEKTSSIGRRLTIKVPTEEINHLYIKKQNDLAKNASIKGFRPGKVPKSILLQRFGETLIQDVVHEAIRQNLGQVLQEHKLAPVGTPQIEPKKFDLAEPLEFAVIFDVLPEIEQINFSVDQLEKHLVEITEEDIENVIQQLRKQHTKWETVDREAAMGDFLLIDFYPIYEGKAELERKNTDFSLQLGSKHMLPGFEEGLIGAKTGEKRELSLTYPQDFPVEDRKGQPVKFHVLIKKVYEGTEPVFDEKFIKEKLDIKTGLLEDLKLHIRDLLEQERDHLVREKLKEQVFDQLITQNVIDVPQALIEQEARQIHDKIYQHQPEHNHNHGEAELNMFADVAKKRVSLGLLLRTYAQQNNIQANKEQVKQRVQQIASKYKDSAQLIEWLSSGEKRHEIESAVIEDTVVEKLIEGVTIIEKAISYSELKGVSKH